MPKARNNKSKRLGRVKTPTVLQMEAVECGAAALAIVLAYHGRFVSLEELRVACGVSRDGTKATNILKAGRHYGMIAKGFSKQPEALRTMPLPVIAFWQFNHFVVVEGFSEELVYLNDPAVGPRTVSHKEFEEGFTGVVLVMEPGPNFEPGGERHGFLGALWDRLRGSESGLAYIVTASLGLALVGLVMPIFVKFFVDSILVSQLNDWLVPLLIGMAVTAAVRSGLSWLQQLHLIQLSTKLAVKSSYVFMRHVLRLPMEFFTQRYGGEVGSRVEINDRLANLLSEQLASNAMNLLAACFYVLMMLCFDVVLTLVGLVIAVLNFVALKYVSRKRKDVNARLLQERGKMVGTAMAGLQAIETLKATGSESDFFARWSGAQAKVLTSTQEMDLYSRGLAAVPSLLTTMSSIAILGVGALRIMDGQMTIGTLVAFQSLMMSFMMPINGLVMLGSLLQQTEGDLNRLDDVMSYDIDPNLADDDARGPSIKPPAKLTGKVELKDISFGYSRLEKPLVKNFNLVVQPGSRVALVGPSGSGKSTLARVISGLYPHWSGEIFLDGQPRSEYSRDTITNSVAMVDQDFFLYEGTIREALTMWDSTISKEHVTLAAMDACIHDDIAARAGGYESEVEEGGRNFSRGQRQRLEIARALVINPSIVVLDEATSALDAVTEQIIDANLRRRGCTCIIVAHRLSTIRDSDEIIVLDRGRVVQRGTHDDLAEQKGLYRNLINF